MDDFEKDYWLHLLPSMTEEHTQILEAILQTERDNLDRLEAKHQAEMQKLNQNTDWQEFQNETEGKTNEEQGKDILKMLKTI
jgi:hypothetical protein